MDETIKTVYKCYIGKELMYRAAQIVDFVKEEGGKSFFELYSSEIDSILDFIKRCETQNLL
jgi:hypothetical protein